MSPHDDMKALRHVIREAQQQPAPELDWDRMEQKLLRRVESNERGAGAQRSRSWQVMAALAAAAVVALFASGLLRGVGPAPSSPVAVTAPAAAARVFGPELASPFGGEQLRAGDRVVAGATALTVDHPGRARWTLEPHATAVVAETGDFLTVTLERGALSAEVVPSARPETFAVEAEGTRVAVHGTAFRVVRDASTLSVTVSEGIVAVGPRSARGQTRGWQLRAGDSGTFAYDGLSGKVSHAATAALAPAPADPTKPAPTAKDPRPETPKDLDKGTDQIASVVSECFARNTVQDAEVRVQVRTELTVDVGADGKVTGLRFEPPVAPAVESCVAAEAKKVRVGASQRGGTATRSLLLGS